MTILHDIPRIDSLQAVNQWLRRECREKDERIARLETLVDALANRLANAAEVLAVLAQQQEALWHWRSAMAWAVYFKEAEAD